jgi:Flp pilus assembly CpaF family ATPase
MTVDTQVDEALVRQLRATVAAGLTERTSAARIAGGRRLDTDDQAALAQRLIDDQLEQHAGDCIARSEAVLTPEAEAALAQAVYDRLFQLGRLQPLLDDEQIMDIHANGCDVVFVEYADGTKVSAAPIAANDDEMIELLREIGRRHGLSEREFNASRPQLNLQLPDGSRLFATAWVCERPSLAIRRHRYLKVDLADLERLGAIDRGLAGFLGAAVKARKQLMIAGATGAGKTTMLRALASEIPTAERIVTIETELELGLDRYADVHPDCVALEAREANVEGVGEVTAAELVRMSLRMNPDRVIVGEVRGDEVIPMLNAMSQGNDGSMCTIHADSSGGVFRKLALYALQAPERLPMEATFLLAAAAIDLLVFIAKSPDGRFVASVRQVTGFDGKQVLTNELFRPGPDGRAIPGTPIPANLLDELIPAGYDPALHDNPGGWWR